MIPFRALILPREDVFIEFNEILVASMAWEEHFRTHPVVLSYLLAVAFPLILRNVFLERQTRSFRLLEFLVEETCLYKHRPNLQELNQLRTSDP